MKIKLNVILYGVVMFFFFSPKATEARHIIGGDVTYNCVFIDSVRMESKFDITFTLYRDNVNGGAQFNPVAQIGVHRGSNLNWIAFASINTQLREKVVLDPQITNPCVILPSNIGVERGIYVTSVVLPWSTESYKISYQRCCRNNSISNLVDPQSLGAAFSVDISPESQRSCNNSPSFNNFPPIVICAQKELLFDHSASDAEGDSLVYSFCSPKTAGGTDGVMGGDPLSCNGVTPDPNNCTPPFTNVEYVRPFYSVEYPLGSDDFGRPGLSIPETTGLLEGLPRSIGQYVVGVCVKEYRDGVLIGQIQRDFQFNVAICEPAVFAKLDEEEIGIKEYSILSCGNQFVEIKNISSDTTYISDYLWEFEIDGETETSTDKNGSIYFPSFGEYDGIMVLNPNSVDCSDTAKITVSVQPDIKADFEFTYDTCVAGPVEFTDLSKSDAGPVLQWDWQMAGLGMSTSKNPKFVFPEPGIHNISLTVKDQNECTDTQTKEVTYRPVPAVLVVKPDRFIGCAPSPITFRNLSTPIDSTYQITWTFSDGGTSDELHPTYLFESPGTYNVHLKLISSLGCETETNFSNLIQIKPSPTAGFTYTPDNINLFDKEVTFTSTSPDATTWFWKFGADGSSFIENPIYNFPDSGFYDVIQIVENDVRCTDTAYVQLLVEPDFFRVPNAFTPDNNNLNDEFKPKGVFYGTKEYEFSIWNRWGQKIYTSNDPEIGWDGSLNNSGTGSQEGVYIYTLSYISSSGVLKKSRGQFTLLR